MYSPLADLKKFGAMLFCGLIVAYFALVEAPSVWADLSADKESFARAPDYELSEARCKSKMFIAGKCDLTLVHRTSKKKLRRDFVMLGYISKQKVYAVQSPEGYVTTNIGLDYVWNRVFFLIAVLGLFGVGGIAVLMKSKNAR